MLKSFKVFRCLCVEVMKCLCDEAVKLLGVDVVMGLKLLSTKERRGAASLSGGGVFQPICSLLGKSVQNHYGG